MRGVLVLVVAAGCGRTGFASLPCDDAHAGDTAAIDGTTASARSTLSLDQVDPGETLVDFPLLVVLDDAHAARDLLDATGSNVRFVDASGNVLPSEIDAMGYAATMTSQGEPLQAWVRVPTITGLATTLQVVIGGNLPAAATQSVWSDDYAAVYHLTDATDATTNHHDGTISGNVLAVAYPGCPIGACMSFDGFGSYISIPDAPTLDLPTPTITGWMYQDGSASGGATMVSREESPSNQDFLLGTSSNAAFTLVTVTGGTYMALTGSAITYGHWTHLQMTYQGVLQLYVAGSPQAMTTIGPDLVHDAQPVLLGATGGASAYLAGMIDEVRIEKVARDPQWIAYEEQAMNNRVITYGPVSR